MRNYRSTISLDYLFQSSDDGLLVRLGTALLQLFRFAGSETSCIDIRGHGCDEMAFGWAKDA